MVSPDRMWQLPSELDASSNHEAHCPKRQSTCELEGDASVDDILNQQFKMYSSLSQTRSDVQKVQSLVPIWKEQQERTGIYEDTITRDTGKPLPEVVMRSLSGGLDFEKKFVEMCCEAETCASFISSEESRETDIIGSASPPASLCKDAKLHEEGTEANLRLLTVDEMQSSEIIGTQGKKAADKEALNLLKWLATSQAAEDINSDDELIRETILSPLLPATTIDKVLEKANMDYESESQKECQDILDSIDDQLQLESSKRKPPFSSNFNCPVESSSNNMIPQVDGSADDEFASPSSGSEGISFALDQKGESKRSSKHCILQNTRTNTYSKDNRNKVWGTLPLSMTHNNFDHASLHCGHTSEKETVESVDSDCLARNEIENNGIKNGDEGVSDIKGVQTLDNCSVRDLMRRKRCYRVEQADSESEITKKLHLDGDEKLKTDGETEVQKSCVLKMTNHDLVCRKAPLVAGSQTGLSLCGPKKFHSTSSSDYSEVSSGKKFKVDSTHVQTDNCPQIDMAALGSVQSSSIENIQSVRDNCMYKCPYGSKSYEQHGQMRSCDIVVGANTATDIQVLQCVRSDGKRPRENLGFYETSGIEPSINDIMGDHMRLTSTRASAMAVKPLDDVIPASAGSYQNEMETWNKHVADNAPDSKGKRVLGVAKYYQNDGSHLCLLKPKFLPPSEGNVRRWLLCDERDQMFQQSDAKEKHMPKWNTRPCLMSKHVQDVDSEKKSPCISSGEMNIIKTSLDGSQDTSQISGPDGKSTPTPLSQIGFCDPARIGCGQQLTVLSIEVLAESRGELLPDPQFDAINIVALGFQNDSDTVVDVLVLLHCKLEPCQRNFVSLSGCKVLVFTDEKHLLKKFINIVSSYDPDILMGWDIQGGSLGFLAERALHLGLGLLNSLSRTPSDSWITSGDTETSEKDISATAVPDISSADDVQESSIIEDEWGRTHSSGVHVGGRIVLNVWRLIRGEVKLNLYSVEAVAEAVLRRKVPSIHNKVLTKWFSGGPGGARYQCVKYITERAKLNLEILSQLDMVNRTSELARIFGIDFFSVLSRGSQYRVESMFLRLAHTQNYLAISPGNQQVASQPAMECLPLVMEPESGFYSDPVIVFDFQSLYPSMIIAYNLCFCTCLGKVVASKENTLGVSSFSPEQHVLRDLKDQILLTPNGVMFVPSKVRRGILPHLLEEILSTRVMVKQAMKKLAPSQQVLQRIFNARQLALKLISNVTYGYTAAGFSGRMPCAELADSIVQCGRCTLERAISFVNQHDKWNAKVIYGDTDSMFVLLKGRTIKECFQIGSEIASAVTAMNPSPVTLKLEKVYQPCFLLTKKRYVGYSYESPDQGEPVFDAKGIETVRRDTCGAVAKIMEQSLRLFFENKDLSEVRSYLQRQWKKILSSKVSIKDFVFAKEVRLGSYSARTSSLPPAAIVATKAMRFDPRAEPRYAERVPYVVIHGEPGARLVDVVVDPLEVLALNSPLRINDLYYINKQVIPALQRVFGLVGADLNQWFLEMPRPLKDARVKHLIAPNSHRTRIDSYYLSKHCILCGGLVQASAHICIQCSENGVAAATAVISKTSKLEQEMQHLVAICDHCGGGGRFLESDVKCTSISCSVFYERRKVQKELLAMNHVAAGAGFYPKCMVEWF
ncbi:DNA polymerase zeta catalytic subunit isoform X2 [Prosopis cineraria]|nr:DNA polymerase zeta catalytic subunit isoform X2 [Prosopis cineraria]